MYGPILIFAQCWDKNCTLHIKNAFKQITLLNDSAVVKKQSSLKQLPDRVCAELTSQAHKIQNTEQQNNQNWSNTNNKHEDEEHYQASKNEKQERKQFFWKQHGWHHKSVAQY